VALHCIKWTIALPPGAGKLHRETSGVTMLNMGRLVSVKRDGPGQQDDPDDDVRPRRTRPLPLHVTLSTALRSRSTRLALALLATSVFACARSREDGPHRIEREYAASAPVHRPPPDETRQEHLACEAQLLEALNDPRVVGTPGLDAVRGQLMASAKAEPNIFVRPPEYEPSDSLEVRGFRALFAKSKNPWEAVSRALKNMNGRPWAARETLLRDGYLYSENPDLAYALVTLVQPEALFGHDTIWIARGERTMMATRERGRYYYADGPLEGQRVRLLHLDWIGAEPPPPPLHRDVRSFAHRLAFDRIHVRHVGENRIVANLRYGPWWVPTVIAVEGARLERICEVVAPSLRLEVDRARQDNRVRRRALQGLRQAILEQVEEELPFDEPRREYGHQLDGKLRSNWAHAYFRGKSYFAFNGDQYPVFGLRGQALTPQVCVDFLTDTFERMSGTSYRPKGESPTRDVGRLDFSAIDGVNRNLLRRVPDFIAFARERPEWFDVHDVPLVDTFIHMGKKARFYAYLAEHADTFAPGDILVIRGKTPWDRRHMHSHSFFVYEHDPITGVPMVVAGNAGKPSLRSWETEARRTPERSIHHRIRPTTAWLTELLVRPPPEEIAELSTGPL
jgi:hypothetical protein